MQLRVKVFHAPVPSELEDQVNGWLAARPAAAVREVQLQVAGAAGMLDEDPVWVYAVMVTYEEPER